MPFPEQGAVSRGCRCARRRERQSQTLRCLLGLCVLVICVLALGVLYLLGKRMGEKAAGDEMPSGRPPVAQRLQAIQPCSCLEPNTWPNIHVSAKNPTSSHSFTEECSNNSHPLLHWENTQEDNPGPGKIKLDNEVFLIIPKDGTYFVYSQVTFYCPNGSCEDVFYCGKKVERIVVAQMISRQSAAEGGGPTLVFSSTRSIVKQRWKESLYVAGSIPLKEGDKLMVNVSNPVLVHQTHDHFSFFGAYLIN